MPLVLKRCTIRPWRLEDAAALPIHANNRNVWLTLRDKFPHPYSRADAEKYLQRAVEAGALEHGFCLEVNGEVAGGIGLHLKEDVHRHVGEFGYWLGEKFWGRGIVTEAVGAFATYCFAWFPLHRLYAEVFSNNPASVRVLEKNGFVFEGRLKNHVFKNGEILDALVYARTQ